MKREALLFALLGAALHLSVLPAWARERSDLPLYLDSSLRWATGEVPYREIPFEYPPAALLILRAPLQLAAATGLRYEEAFALWMTAFDALALFAAYLAGLRRSRAAARASLAAAWVLLALPAAVLYTRFDLAPGALMALAVALPAAPLLAGAALGAAAAIKLYPLAIAPAAAVAVFRAGGAPALRRALLAGIFAAAALSLPAALEGGRASLGFFGYHAQRGVQLQSLWAAAALCLARLRGAPVAIVHSFGAEELQAAPAGLAALSIALQLLCGLAAALALWRRRASLPEAALGAFAGFVAFGKVGSPQFFLALAPLAACAAADAPWAAGAVAASGALLAWEFPLHYGALFHNQGPWALVVLVRLLLLAGVSIWLLLRARKPGTLAA
jgi:hypothetical protein